MHKSGNTGITLGILHITKYEKIRGFLQYNCANYKDRERVIA